MEFESTNFRAPELYGDFWPNSEPVFLRDLRGQIVLVEFWDYTSLDCLRALPYTNDWCGKYRDFGLVVVGVHTPQFVFARKEEVIRRVTERMGISYPVVMDNEALLWSAFGARSWPTKFLIDKDGFIRYSHQGEGGYQQFERALRQLVVQAGFHGRLPDLSESVHGTGESEILQHRATGEIHLGYLKGALGNNDGYNPESTLEYEDPGIYLPERFYAKGKWLSQRECFSFKGLPNDSGSLIVRYDATEVNAVMNPASRRVSEVTVHQDGHPLVRECRGEDIVPGNDGASLVLVDSPKLYNLVRNREFGSHILTLTTSASGLEVFTFSFAASVLPELIHSN
jgi:peroxiredoxin